LIKLPVRNKVLCIRNLDVGSSPQAGCATSVRGEGFPLPSLPIGLITACREHGGMFHALRVCLREADFHPDVQPQSSFYYLIVVLEFIFI